MNIGNIERPQGSGVPELVISGVAMLVAVVLFVIAFQSAATDGAITASAWLIAFAAGAIGIFFFATGMRKQRIAVEAAEQQAANELASADAASVARAAIERARKS